MSDHAFAELMGVSVNYTKQIRQSQGVAPTECKTDYSLIVSEGREAFESGQESSSCPYSGMIKSSYWLSGWNDADMGY